MRDLRVMISRHHRTFMLKLKDKQVRQLVVDRRTTPDMHVEGIQRFLQHHAALESKLPLRHQQPRAA